MNKILGNLLAGTIGILVLVWVFYPSSRPTIVRSEEPVATSVPKEDSVLDDPVARKALANMLGAEGHALTAVGKKLPKHWFLSTKKEKDGRRFFFEGIAHPTRNPIWRNDPTYDRKKERSFKAVVLCSSDDELWNEENCKVTSISIK